MRKGTDTRNVSRIIVEFFSFCFYIGNVLINSYVVSNVKVNTYVQRCMKIYYAHKDVRL